MDREEAIEKVRQMSLPKETMEILEALAPELRESEDERIKNKSGYYKAGKFWKASTLWNAVKGKYPQRVPNRYILQECTWNISSLQHFADEVKNVQEVDLNYPIILDMNGNILDGAHRVVKAYLEGKDIDIVYLGDDEWPEPDYDEEKAVRESEDERINKAIFKALSKKDARDVLLAEGVQVSEALAYLEKQKEQKPKNILTDDDSLQTAYLKGQTDVLEYPEAYGLQKEQKPAEWSKNDTVFLNEITDFFENKTVRLQHDIDMYAHWLKSLPERFNLQPKQEWSEEDRQIARKINDVILGDLKLEIGYLTNEDRKKMSDWFTSMFYSHPKSSDNWKPSEEQMEAFRSYIKNFQEKAEATVGGWNNFDVMIRLYEQLKKL